jgi:hypothetical protein
MPMIPTGPFASETPGLPVRRYLNAMVICLPDAVNE